MLSITVADFFNIVYTIHRLQCTLTMFLTVARASLLRLLVCLYSAYRNIFPRFKLYELYFISFK